MESFFGAAWRGVSKLFRDWRFLVVFFAGAITLALLKAREEDQD